jgi:hypothetical protein
MLLRLMLPLFCATLAQAGDVKHNPFGDPFLQVTSGQPNCPVPQEPTFTDEQYKAEAHDRSQRGVSCWMAGRCRLHSAYLYDAEIIPRVKQAISVAGRFAHTSVWALGQRRYVWLKGCVASAEQAAELERLVRTIDDVEGVQNELMVGSQGRPPYAAAR